jgi:hypothetical protein
MTEQKKFDQWAIVELFGHTRIAGRVSEQTIGGCAFVRVDVPAVGKEQPLTKLFGQGAIYAISFVDEAAATMAATALQIRPIHPWQLGEAIKALPDAIKHGDDCQCQDCRDKYDRDEDDSLPI